MHHEEFKVASSPFYLVSLATIERDFKDVKRYELFTGTKIRKYSSLIND